MSVLTADVETVKSEAAVSAAASTAPEKGKWIIRRPPAGGLVLYVTWKVLGGYDRPQSSSTTGEGRCDRDFQDALGADRLWVREDEARALAAGELVESLKRRMLPHFSYVFAGKTTSLALTRRDGDWHGTFATDAGETGTISGRLEARNGKVVRLELIAKSPGERVEDFGFSAGLQVVPESKKVPVALAFVLAAADDPLARVVPYRAGDERYLR